MAQEASVSRYNRKDAVSTQAACAEILTLTKKLPSKQAKSIKRIIDDVRAELTSEFESRVPSLFEWDKLPGEVKNQIYKLLLVSENTIQPIVRHARSPAKRSWASHGIQGQVLVLSKSIYKEALPILLGDNTFLFNSDLAKYLGYGLDKTVEQLSKGPGTPPPERAGMVRRVVVKNTIHAPHSHAVALRRLKGLKELIIWHDTLSGLQRVDMVNGNWEQQLAVGPNRIAPFLAKYLANPDVLAYYVVSHASRHTTARRKGRSIIEHIVKACKYKIENSGEEAFESSKLVLVRNLEHRYHNVNLFHLDTVSKF